MVQTIMVKADEVAAQLAQQEHLLAQQEQLLAQQQAQLAPGTAPPS